MESANYELVVVENFLGHAKGDVISEPGEVEELIDSEWQGNFVKRLKTTD